METPTNAQTSAARDPQTYAIIGAGMGVHSELGCGFVEPVYRRPFAIELAAKGVPFKTDVRFPVIYKGEPTGLYYVADFVCFDEVVVEIKALKSIGPLETAQTLNYLKVSGLGRALVINFGARSLQWERLVL
jgi:GxxExxY protein